jgi:hypothetical protein
VSLFQDAIDLAVKYAATTPEEVKKKLREIHRSCPDKIMSEEKFSEFKSLLGISEDEETLIEDRTSKGDLIRRINDRMQLLVAAKKHSVVAAASKKIFGSASFVLQYQDFEALKKFHREINQ